MRLIVIAEGDADAVIAVQEISRQRCRHTLCVLFQSQSRVTDSCSTVVLFYADAFGAGKARSLSLKVLENSLNFWF